MCIREKSAHGAQGFWHLSMASGPLKQRHTIACAVHSAVTRLSPERAALVVGLAVQHAGNPQFLTLLDSLKK